LTKESLIKNLNNHVQELKAQDERVQVKEAIISPPMSTRGQPVSKQSVQKMRRHTVNITGLQMKGLSIPNNIEFAVADNYDIALNTKLTEEEVK